MSAEMSSRATVDPGTVARLRAGRAGVRAALHQLEEALAAPLGGRPWAAGVQDALRELESAFNHHVAVTEGPDGLHPTLIADAPRLAHGVAELQVEHAKISQEVAALLDAVAGDASDPMELGRIRDRATALLTAVTRHRQRGSDLVWQAYQVDLGVGD